MKKQTQRAAHRAVPGSFLIALLVGFFLLSTSSCTTTQSNSDGASSQLRGYNPNNPAVKARNAKIATEERGDYYIGRRWWVNGTRFWGYVRRPGEPWIRAKLVIMDESIKHQPDRVAEVGAERVHGFDHNYEYRLYGSFTGKKTYDPNSDFMLPTFRLTGYELLSSNPGFLFYPGEPYSPNKLPPKHPLIRR